MVVSCHSLSRRDTGEPGLTSRAEPGAGINIGRWLGGGERGKEEKRQFDELTLAAVEHLEGWKEKPGGFIQRGMKPSVIVGKVSCDQLLVCRNRALEWIAVQVTNKLPVSQQSAIVSKIKGTFLKNAVKVQL